MARPLRIEYGGALCHTTTRGNARQDVFLNDEDRRSFLEVTEIPGTPYCSRPRRADRGVKIILNLLALRARLTNPSRVSAAITVAGPVMRKGLLRILIFRPHCDQDGSAACHVVEKEKARGESIARPIYDDLTIKQPILRICRHTANNMPIDTAPFQGHNT